MNKTIVNNFLKRIEIDFKSITDKIEGMTGKEVMDDVYKYYSVQEAKYRLDELMENLENLEKEDFDAMERLMSSNTNILLSIYYTDLGNDFSKINYEDFQELLRDI